MLVLAPQLLQPAAPRHGARLGDDRDERGASAVEYGLLVAGIAAVIVGAVFGLGQGIFSDLFTGDLQLDQPEHGRPPADPASLVRQPPGDRDPLTRRRVAAEPELRPGRPGQIRQ